MGMFAAVSNDTQHALAIMLEDASFVDRYVEENNRLVFQSVIKYFFVFTTWASGAPVLKNLSLEFQCCVGTCMLMQVLMLWLSFNANEGSGL
jgi:hypothetical protein